MLNNKGKLLLKVRTKEYIYFNGVALFFLIISIFFIPVMMLKMFVVGILLIFFCSSMGMLHLILDGFMRKNFEMYEEGFIPISIPIQEIFTYKKKFIFFKTIVRVEFEEIDNIKLIRIYTRSGEYADFSSREIEKDIIEKLLEQIKNYSESNNIKIRWYDKLIPAFQARIWGKKIINHEIKYYLGVDSHAKNKYT